MSARTATGLAITNPLVKYRSLIATKAITPDPAQHRLAVHLQKLYERLIDYEPQVEYSDRIDRIQRAIRAQQSSDDKSDTPISRSWRSLSLAKERRDSLALTRQLTSQESAIEMASPKGLMLHGEVGTGKSMLIDLFADCLPNSKKRRWHFNTFMLEAFAKLDSLRRQRNMLRSSSMPVENEHSLLWLARDMIQTSPILFLDEFQLPDRAASKIMTQLMTSFFHLGGVLIATSNRMPEELAKASGVEFTPPPGKLESIGWRLGLIRKLGSRNEGLFGGQSEFAAFLDVLKARCEIWEMEATNDYRRLESKSIAESVNRKEDSGWQIDGHDDLQSIPTHDQAHDSDVRGEDIQVTFPAYYHLETAGLNDTIKTIVEQVHDSADVWQPSSLKVYGRKVQIPRTFNGVTLWTFEELCKGNFGPADYTSIASTYHTIILTDVPVMTLLMKNEARRFITLLDALYECKCKLLVAAEAGPDDIFFPEKFKASSEGDSDDAVYSETIAEVYQDATAPFRPNVLTQNPNYAEPDPEPDYTHARLAGLLNADALEDDPPNKPHRHPFGRSFGRTDSEMERKPIDPDDSRHLHPRFGPDFGKTGVFTGEDERFAYRRAQSRLWEMCGAKWWARQDLGWHRPLPPDVRRWERSSPYEREPSKSIPHQWEDAQTSSSEITVGDSIVDETRDKQSFKQVGSTSPFRTSPDPPPKFGWQHIWGTLRWGRRAGAWGQGVDGLKDRGNEKR